jgi:Ca2+-binding RTX toxin-like protein
MLNSKSVQLFQQYLSSFAARGDFASAIASVFGTQVDTGTLGQQWLNGDFSLVPPIEVLSPDIIGTANGAYAASLDRIYVSADFLARHQNDPQAIAELLLEEFGHKLDRVLNGNIDTPGDEGAIFRLVVTGKPVTAEILAALRARDDRGVIAIAGNAIEVEKQDFPGTNGNDFLPLAGQDNSGDDVFRPLTGRDTVQGGTGTDLLVADYSGNDNSGASSSAQGISSGVDLVNGNGNFFAFKGGGTTDFDQVQYSSIERFNITGTQYNDNIQGGNNNDTLLGGNGDDTLSGFQGVDSLDGGAGNDRVVIDLSNTTSNNSVNIITSSTNYGTTLNSIESLYATGGSGNDTFVGGALTDNLVGGTGDDLLNAGTGGRDTVQGGTGTDLLIADYSGNDNSGASSSAQGIFSSVDLVNGNGSFFAYKGGGTTDFDQVQYSSIDRFNITGTQYNDNLQGGNNNDTLVGGGSSDTIQGYDGNDVIKGAKTQVAPGTQEIDLLTGGAGRDRFILGEAGVDFYDDGDTATPGTNNYALITDFDARFDSIQLGKSRDNYTLTAATINGVSGTGIYLNKPTGEPAELVGLIQGATSLSGLPQGNRGSNQGQTTFTITGNGFLPTDVISLVSASGGRKGCYQNLLGGR